MTAGAVRETHGDPARSPGRHRRPPARGGDRGHRAREQPGQCAGRTIGSASRSPSSRHSPTSIPPRCRRACRPASRSAPGTPRENGSIWVNATHVCTCEVDVVDRAGAAAPLHRERGLRADDQPQRRRGADRGRRRPGHRRCPATSTSPTTSTATRSTTTFMDYLLPTASEVPVIEYGHIETPSPGPGGYKGVGEGGAIGAPAAVVNAVATRSRRSGSR